MAYLILEILGFLIAAALLGGVVGWLCRSLAEPRRPASAASRTRAGQREQEEHRKQLEALEARLAEALEGRRAAEAEGDAAALRRLEQEHAAARGKLEAREREIARLNAELEARRGQIAMPLPPHTVSSPLTPGSLDVPEPEPEPDPGTEPDPDPEPEIGMAPRGLVAPIGEAEDLKRITGIGPGIERALNENGIFHHRQIAELTAPNIAWLDHHLRLKGRIERDDWVGQAKTLLAGGGLAELGSLAGRK